MIRTNNKKNKEKKVKLEDSKNDRYNFLGHNQSLENSKELYFLNKLNIEKFKESFEGDEDFNKNEKNEENKEDFDSFNKREELLVEKKLKKDTVETKKGKLKKVKNDVNKKSETSIKKKKLSSKKVKNSQSIENIVDNEKGSYDEVINVKKWNNDSLFYDESNNEEETVDVKNWHEKEEQNSVNSSSTLKVEEEETKQLSLRDKEINKLIVEIKEMAKKLLDKGQTSFEYDSSLYFLNNDTEDFERFESFLRLRKFVKIEGIRNHLLKLVSGEIENNNFMDVNNSKNESEQEDTKSQSNNHIFKSSVLKKSLAYSEKGQLLEKIVSILSNVKNRTSFQFEGDTFFIENIDHLLQRFSIKKNKDLEKILVFLQQENYD